MTHRAMFLVRIFSSATGWINTRFSLLSAPTPVVGQDMYGLSCISSPARKIRNVCEKTRFPANFNLLHIKIDLKMKTDLRLPLYWLYALVGCQHRIRRQWRHLGVFRMTANVLQNQVSGTAAELFDFLYIFIYLNGLAE